MKVEFPLSDMVEEVCHTFQAPAKIQGICMKTAITPMISIKGDEKAIRSLITILLDNAVNIRMKGGGLTLLSGKRKTVFICLYLIRQNIFQKNRLLVYLIVFIGQIFPEIPRQEDTDLDFL